MDTLLSFDGINWKGYLLPDSAKYYPPPTAPFIPPKYPINYITFDSKGQTWVAGYYAGIFSFNGISWRYYSLNGKHGECTSIYFDKIGTGWAGTYGHGLLLFDGKKYWNHFYGSALTSEIAQDNKGNILVGEYIGCGIYSFNGTTWFYHDSNNSPLLPNCNSRFYFSVDMYNNIWITGGGLNGLLVYNEDGLALSNGELANNEVAQSIYFNTSTQKIILSIHIPKKNIINIQFFNVAGIEVKKIEPFSIMPGENKIEFEETNLPAGIYFYSLEVSRELYYGKLLIQRLE